MDTADVAPRTITIYQDVALRGRDGAHRSVRIAVSADLNGFWKGLPAEEPTNRFRRYPPSDPHPASMGSNTKSKPAAGPAGTAPVHHEGSFRLASLIAQRFAIRNGLDAAPPPDERLLKFCDGVIESFGEDASQDEITALLPSWHAAGTITERVTRGDLERLGLLGPGSGGQDGGIGLAGMAGDAPVAPPRASSLARPRNASPAPQPAPADAFPEPRGDELPPYTLVAGPTDITVAPSAEAAAALPESERLLRRSKVPDFSMTLADVELALKTIASQETEERVRRETMELVLRLPARVPAEFVPGALEELAAVAARLAISSDLRMLLAETTATGTARGSPPQRAFLVATQALLAKADPVAVTALLAAQSGPEALVAALFALATLPPTSRGVLPSDSAAGTALLALLASKQASHLSTLQRTAPGRVPALRALQSVLHALLSLSTPSSLAALRAALEASAGSPPEGSWTLKDALQLGGTLDHPARVLLAREDLPSGAREELEGMKRYLLRPPWDGRIAALEREVALLRGMVRELASAAGELGRTLAGSTVGLDGDDGFGVGKAIERVARVADAAGRAAARPEGRREAELQDVVGLLGQESVVYTAGGAAGDGEPGGEPCEVS
ncbi:hypothetical protein DFJ74DRAFT_193494 [Hyaloraphidium curvatum]|nr:hypothetical protein DFJ74DRAFT_193494 [Hyaloraphidium curvatum]